MTIADVITIDRAGDTLIGKSGGVISEEIDRDKGFLRGSPIIALLYIIFAGNIIEVYQKETKETKMGNRS